MHCYGISTLERSQLRVLKNSTSSVFADPKLGSEILEQELLKSWLEAQLSLGLWTEHFRLAQATIRPDLEQDPDYGPHLQRVSAALLEDKL